MALRSSAINTWFQKLLPSHWYGSQGMTLILGRVHHKVVTKIQCQTQLHQTGNIWMYQYGDVIQGWVQINTAQMTD